MRHQRAGRKLGRDSAHRKALYSNLAGALIEHGRIKTTIAKAKDAGGSALMEPFDALDGGRIAVIADPAGAAMGIWQPGAHKGAQLVNEPSAYAMSALMTADPEGAKRFYPEVFGWERPQPRTRQRPVAETPESIYYDKQVGD